jgi:hypothetical protein
MTLADLKKLSIKQQYRIRFVLPNGMECVITQHGIAQVPALKGVPDFNLEQDLASVGEFLLEPAVASDKKNAPKSRTVLREELAAMANAGGAVAHSHDDHEDE